MASSDRVIVVSGDCHIDPSSAADLGPYLEQRHQDDFEVWLERRTQANLGLLVSQQYRSEKEAVVELDAVPPGSREVYRQRLLTGMSFTKDPDVRVAELEQDGIVAEVLYHNGNSAPFFRYEAETREKSIDLQAAGFRAYNRWLADLCRIQRGRMIGIALLTPPGYDIDAAVQVIREAKEVGLHGVMCPTSPSDLPPLIDEYYEPLWAECAELELPLHVHLGWGARSVDNIEFRANAGPAAKGVIRAEVHWLSRRPLWLLIFAGVLERYPSLKLIFAEQGASWIPSTLSQLDAAENSYDNEELSHALPLDPSEYWVRQCYVAASMITRGEVEMRSQIGLETMMFGTDYPHLESTWPTSKAWIQAAFEGAPERDARLILGENAIRAYGLDREQLAAAAERAGPTIDEVVGGTSGLAEEVQQWLEHRGVRAPVEAQWRR